MDPRLPSPKDLLRLGAIVCLLGAFVSLLLAARNRDAVWAQRLPELSSFLFFAMLLFGLFYLQYQLVQGYSKRDLDLRFGYVQSLGCVAILLLAGLGLLFEPLQAALAGGLHLDALVLMCVFGEGTFVANVVWSYRHQAAPARRVLRPDRPSPTWGWPRSPAVIFGIAAAFFAGIGILVLAVAAASRLPAPSPGGFSWISPAFLWWMAAAPFAAFALPYRWMEREKGWQFRESSTRIHFFCTFLVVLDLLRLYKDWALSLNSPLSYPLTAGDYLGLFALGALAVAAFGWNVQARKGQPLPR